MALAATRTIASRGFRIFGSGTDSTRTSCRPCQQSARMPLAAAARLPRGGRCLAGLEEGARAAQRVDDDALRRAAGDAREHCAERAPRRHVLQPRGDDRAAAAGRVAELERAEAQQPLAAQRAPGELVAVARADDIERRVGE